MLMFRRTIASWTGPGIREVIEVENAQLYQFFKDRGVLVKEVAERTGYSYNYVVDLLNGLTPLTDSARFRFMRAFPETAMFLMSPALQKEGDGK